MNRLEMRCEVPFVAYLVESVPEVRTFSLCQEHFLKFCRNVLKNHFLKEWKTFKGILG